MKGFAKQVDLSRYLNITKENYFAASHVVFFRIFRYSVKIMVPQAGACLSYARKNNFRMKIRQTGALVHLILIVLLLQLFSCHQNRKPDTAKEEEKLVDSLDMRYRDFLLDHLTKQELEDKSIVRKKRNELLQKAYFVRSPYNPIYLAYAYMLEDRLDSIPIVLHALEGRPLNPDQAVLKDYFMIRADFSFDEMTNVTLMKKLIDAKEFAAKNKSTFTFLFYNLLSNANYRRGDYRQALRDIESWYFYHPERADPRVSQVYQEVKFMQYMALRDFAKLKGSLDSCRHYARLTGDTATIMRMYDLQSQYYYSINDNKRAVEASRAYFDYLRSSRALNAYAFANLAKNFMNNQQIDSAIKYFNAGLRFIKENKIKHNTLFYYQNLQAAYALKGDYERAYFSLDSAFRGYKNNATRMEWEKMNDINTKYETEKKDQAIKLLKTTNAFSHKIMVQQRWIFVILLALVFSLAFFIYFRNKQKLLQNINQRIMAENKQLILEQKTRQNQLNPHFIYNAIANLQGLISSEQKAKANQYLLLLSRQIRDILELNREDYISLEQEIKSLHNYILLQQMRYQDVFDFEIKTGDLDLDNVMIPPMLIQPFVENAIEHAFKNLSHKGQLRISFREDDEQLHITVSDNGWGVQMHTEQVKHKTSLSQTITRERLELLFAEAEARARIEITPNYNEDKSGYKVDIYIPLVLF